MPAGSFESNILATVSGTHESTKIWAIIAMPVCSRSAIPASLAFQSMRHSPPLPLPHTHTCRLSSIQVGVNAITIVAFLVFGVLENNGIQPHYGYVYVCTMMMRSC